MDDVTVGRFAKERKDSVCRGSACHYGSLQIFQALMGSGPRREARREEEAV